MYLDQLAYFIEIVKCGSISAAAKNLYLSQPALSQSVSNLESELGGRLIKRSHSGIKPTMFGDIVFTQAVDIISQLDGALSSWKELSARSMEFSGTAKVSCTPDISDLLASSVTDELQYAYPNVVLYVAPRQSMFFRFSDFLESNVAISIGSSLSGLMPELENEARELDLCFIPFSTLEPTLLLNKKNPLSEKNCLTLEDIKQLKICVFPEDPPAPFTRFFGGISCQMSSEDALAGYIASNPGSAMLITLTAACKLTGKYRNLVCLPISAPDSIPEFEPVCHFLVHKKPELLTPAEQCALEVLKYRLKCSPAPNS